MADMGPPALTAVLHLIRVLADRGLLSPNEIENLYAATIDVVAEQDADYVQKQLDPIFVEIRQHAQTRWSGHNDPEDLT